MGNTVDEYRRYITMNSTEVQNPRHRLDDKCSCLSNVFGSVLACAKSAHMFCYSLCGLCLTLPQTVRLFYASLRSQTPQQQYIIHCMHQGITLWAYLSEPLVKDSHKCLSSKEKPHNHSTALTTEELADAERLWIIYTCTSTTNLCEMSTWLRQLDLSLMARAYVVMRWETC